jgi:hypothetical protein
MRRANGAGFVDQAKKGRQPEAAARQVRSEEEIGNPSTD